MKRHKILPALASGTILLWLLTALPVMPSYAADGVGLTLNPNQGRIGDLIEVDGYGFGADAQLYIYFSSNKAGVGDHVEIKLTAYEGVGVASIDAEGNFISPIPSKSPANSTTVRIVKRYGTAPIISMPPTAAIST